MNIFIVIIAQYLYFLPILYFVLTLFSSNLKKDILKLSILAFPIAFILTKALGFVFYNPRPFVVEHVQPLVAHAADNGFPSDHTVLTMTIASIIFVYNKKFGIILALISLFVGFSRVFAKIHHPVDILGGISVATFSVYISFYILKRFFKQSKQQKTQEVEKQR